MSTAICQAPSEELFGSLNSQVMMLDYFGPPCDCCDRNVANRYGATIEGSILTLWHRENLNPRSEWRKEGHLLHLGGVEWSVGLYLLHLFPEDVVHWQFDEDEYEALSEVEQVLRGGMGILLPFYNSERISDTAVLSGIWPWE